MTAPWHRMLAIAAAVLGLAAAADVAAPIDPEQLATEIATERDHISALELGEQIMRGESLRVIDLRSAGEFAQLHVPGAARMALEDLARATLPRSTAIVLYSEGGTHAAQAWMLLRLRGYTRVRFLREGLYEWIARVLEPSLASDATAAERAEFERAQLHTRFFGGMAHVDVPRSELPVGYWTTRRDESHEPDRLDDESGSGRRASTSQMVARIRRRGC
jgi:rhodanese-related sulfurtransferase